LHEVHSCTGVALGVGRTETFRTVAVASSHTGLYYWTGSWVPVSISTGGIAQFALEVGCLKILGGTRGHAFALGRLQVVIGGRGCDVLALRTVAG